MAGSDSWIGRGVDHEERKSLEPAQTVPFSVLSFKKNHRLIRSPYPLALIVSSHSMPGVYGVAELRSPVLQFAEQVGVGKVCRQNPFGLCFLAPSA